MRAFSIGAVVIAAITSSTFADAVVYDTGIPTGFFAPFNSSTQAGKKFGDSGWFGSGGDAPVGLSSVTLGLATFSPTGGSIAQGKTDLVFTFNNGDPSGLVFGNGATLYSTTITDVTLPASSGGTASYFSLSIPLPGTLTTGGFNNIGFSLGVDNFNYGGSFGFQNRGGFNSLGFYTNNASEYFPSTNSWELFAFGPNDPADIANFVMTVTVPEPGALALAPLALGLLRRRRVV